MSVSPSQIEQQETSEMPIPALTPDGLLPAGVHDCTLEEIRERFGTFQRSDVRCRLFDRLEEFVKQAQASGLIAEIIVNGSFVTDKEVPSDIDLIVVTLPHSRFPPALRPVEYNALSKRHIRRNFGFDMLLAEEGQMDVGEHIDFFSQVRDRPGIRKGLLRIRL